MGLPSGVEKAAIFVVAPHYVGRGAAARLTACLLSRGATRVRVERGAACALAALPPDDEESSIPTVVR
jgi:hypothetical protein